MACYHTRYLKYLFVVILNLSFIYNSFNQTQKVDISFQQIFIIPENVNISDDCGRFYSIFTYDLTSKITFEITGGNVNGNFAVNPDNGNIRINNTTNLSPGKRELIIRAKDGDFYDIDTAVILIKAAGNCVFIDPYYSGTERGTRLEPYNSWTDIPAFTPGYAYLQKRNTKYSEDRILVPSPGGTYDNHIILGAYGQGNRPELDGIDAGADKRGILIGDYDNNYPAGYIDIFSFVIYNWSHSGIDIYPNSNHISIWDVDISHSQNFAGIYIYHNLANPDAKLYNRIYNTVSHDNYESHGIKFEGSGNSVTNCQTFNNKSHGLHLSKWTSDNLVNYLLSFDNGHSGINIDGDTNRVYNSILHNNYNGVRFSTDAHENTVIHCITRNNSGSGVAFIDSVFNTKAENIVSDNNLGNGIMFSSSATNITVCKSEICNNQEAGILANSASNLPSAKILINTNIINENRIGIKIHESDKTEVYNNTLYNNTEDNDITIYSSEAVIKNNILKNISGDCVKSNNLFYQNTNPEFLNPYINDFRLNFNSPAIDAGVDVGLDYDFDGNQVPFNTYPDIGAYEFVLRNPSDTLPHAPSNLSANATHYYQIVINWKDNSDNEYGFEIERSLNPESGFQKIHTVYQNVTSFTNSGLSPLTTYYYRIKAYNNIGSSGYISIISITTPAVPPPNAPSSLRTTNVRASYVSLRWNDNSNDEEKFELERSNISGDGFSVIATLSANQTTYTDNGLTPTTTYYYRTRAYSQYGYSTYSNELSVATTALQPPVAPTNLSASDITKNSLLLYWEDNSNNEESFRIYRSLTSGSGFNEIGYVGANISQFTDDGLEPNTTYYYRIRAYNEDGISAYSNELETTTLPPLPPETPGNLTTTYISDNSTTLEWTDNSNNESGFEIFRTFADSINYQLIHTTNKNINTYTDSLLLSDTTYLYSVRAINDDGISGFTNILSVTTLSSPPPGNPTGLVSLQVTKFTVSISWLDNFDDEDGFEVERSTGNNNSYEVIGTLEADITDFQDVELIPNTTYYYRTRAFNQIGYSAYSNVINITTLPLEIPNPPTLGSINILSENTVKLAWKDNSDNESGFQIERAEESTDYLLIYATSNDDTSYTDSLLSPGIMYYYRVRAFSGDGFSSYSNVLEVIIGDSEPPVTPSSLKAESVDYNAITLTWEDNSENETGFIIKRALEPDKNFEIIKTLQVNNTSFTDNNLKANTIYYYLVNAINNTGESGNSNTAIASTMSISETKRVWEGLVAYYNFNLNSGHIVHDFSNNGEPLDLAVIDPSAIIWENNNKFEIVSNTYIKSVTPATKIVEACKKTNEITLECWLKPSLNHLDRISNILSISKNNEDLGALLAQEHIFDNNYKSYNYCIRLKTKATATNGAPDLYAADELSFITLHHLIYTKDKYGVEKIYLNGEEVASNIRPEGMDNWDSQYYLMLGNDLDQNYPWLGTYYNVAIYNIALTREQILKNYNAGPKDNIAESVIEYDIKISPNPSEGIINLTIIPQSENDFADKTMIQISDIMGDLLYSEIIEDPNRELTKPLNLSKLAKGIYILRVITNDHFNSEKFIIK